MNPRHPIETALVVEGGGMRGIFAAGVLDSFLESSVPPFDLYLGVSAGACNLASYLAGQHRRNYRTFTRFMARPEFFDRRRFLLGGHWMDLDWMWDALAREDPLDTEAVIDNLGRRNRRFHPVVTSVRSGRPMYLTPSAVTLNDDLKASCAIPLMYRGGRRINGNPVVDGGVSDPIPVFEAYRQGARRMLVIRSRPSDYVKRRGFESSLTPLLLRRRAALARVISEQPGVYNRSLRFIARPPSGVQVLEVAPTVAQRCGRTTCDLQALEHDYQMGLELGVEALTAFAGKR